VINKASTGVDVEENDIKPPVVDEIKTTLNNEINVSM
jgi:hypothetical protein